MPLIEGDVQINPLTGDVTLAVGCAGEVFGVLDAATDYGAFVGPDKAKARTGVATLAKAVAKVIPHIVTNAQVTTTITPADVALQTSTAPGSPTGPGPAPVPLATPGTIA